MLCQKPRQRLPFFLKQTIRLMWRPQTVGATWSAGPAASVTKEPCLPIGRNVAEPNTQSRFGRALSAARLCGGGTRDMKRAGQVLGALALLALLQPVHAEQIFCDLTNRA